MAADLTLGSILVLAAADAVNPCAIAVLALVLISVLTATKSKMMVLKSGLAFIASVYIFYFFYGLIMVGLFKSLVLYIAPVKVYLFYILGVLAMVLGLLNIKDAVWYKAGSCGTEMPLFMRPKMKNVVTKITSPKGAFFIGIFVTLFLLPCTIGPYIAASGILSVLDFISVIPWLLIYNVVFVLPMVGITLIIYLGYSTIEQVGGWKDKNIRILHFIAGILLFGIGLAMVLGWL